MQLAVSLCPFVSPMVPDLVNIVPVSSIMAVPELIPNATNHWQNRELGGKQESKGGARLDRAEMQKKKKKRRARNATE